MENIIFGIGYTALLGVVAFYYWIEGNKRGVQETVQLIWQYEPEALMRVRPKLLEILNVTTDVE